MWSGGVTQCDAKEIVVPKYLIEVTTGLDKNLGLHAKVHTDSDLQQQSSWTHFSESWGSSDYIWSVLGSNNCYNQIPIIIIFYTYTGQIR